MKKGKGILVTFEGNEGCGKSTQIQLLYEYLKSQGLKVYVTREPGGTAVSDGIRTILLDKTNKALTPLTETLLFMASRAQLVEEVIKPRLKQGYVVLCDRWVDATIAYQGYAGGVSVDWIKDLGTRVTQGLSPDQTIYFDLPLEVGLKRAKSHKKADRMELKTLGFHRRVRKGYERLASEEPRRIKRLKIDPKDSIEKVHAEVRKLFARVSP